MYSFGSKVHRDNIWEGREGGTYFYMCVLLHVIELCKYNFCITVSFALCVIGDAVGPCVLSHGQTVQMCCADVLLFYYIHHFT
jgi:hypothetical protein